jgi:hypothetical protein
MQGTLRVTGTGWRLAAGGFPGIARATRALHLATARRYSPDHHAGVIYQQVYGIFTALRYTLGRYHAEWLHELKRIKHYAAGTTA